MTGETFEEIVLGADGPIVVEFMSYGCEHCRALEPIIQQVAQMMKGKAKVFRVNTAVEQTLSESFQITGTPTLVMFLNGQVVGRSEGPRPKVSTLLATVTQPFES